MDYLAFDLTVGQRTPAGCPPAHRLTWN